MRHWIRCAAILAMSVVVASCTAPVPAPVPEPAPVPAPVPEPAPVPVPTPDTAAGQASTAVEAENFLSPEEMHALGEELVDALNRRAGEELCLTVEEVYALHTPSTSSIIQIGRLGWLRRVADRIQNAELRFVGAKPGPQFRQSMTSPGPPSPFQARVPMACNMAIEVTVNGDPATLWIDRMYRVDGSWKVFDATLAD